MNKIINIIGAGLAGVESAWYLANKGYQVNLYEMRGKKTTPAHKTDKFAELVCSNTFRNNEINSGPGLLKQEMRMLNSLTVACAEATSVPAGSALAVDREDFSALVTEKIAAHPNITIINEEVTTIPAEPLIIASGPLTSDALHAKITELTGQEDLYFFDAASPIVTKESIDFNKVYYKDRGDEESTGAYINCPMEKDEYQRFWEAVCEAEIAPLHDFELKVFEGCKPFEVDAKRGFKTLLFGPMKNRGLEHPVTGIKPFAVVQLRQDDAAASLYNLVGFQTNLKWGEQDKILKLIPGLEEAEVVRYGVMHRNTYINSPKLLDEHFKLINSDNTYFAGQITGVEGYIESAASGIMAAMSLERELENKPMVDFTNYTMMGSLAKYISNKAIEKNFQPMKSNFGIVDQVQGKGRFKSKKEKHSFYAERSITEMTRILNEEI